MTRISELAVIESGAKIDEDVEIGPFCHISSEATIKQGTEIASGVVIRGRVTIGERNKISSYAVIGGDPQSTSYSHEDVEVIIGNDNKIREYVSINAGTLEFTRKTVIGNNNFIMAYAHIAHDCVVRDGCIFANAATLAGHVEIGDFVNVGGLTPIHQFVKIGSYSMIGGASAVSQDIPPFVIAEGNRAKIRGVNRIGLRRKLSRELIDELSHTLKELSHTTKPLKHRVEEIKNSSTSAQVQEFCEFILNSKRGVPILRRAYGS